MALADHGLAVGCSAMIVAAILGVVFLVFVSPDNKSKPAASSSQAVVADVADTFGAYYICKQFVEDKLLAPKSAEFADFDQSKVHDLGSGDFEVISYVDAQNKFGAQIRQRYLCKVHYAGNRNWSLKGLTFKP